MGDRIKASDLMAEENKLERIEDYSPIKVQVGDEFGFVMMDNNSFILSKEKFLLFMERATLAYEAENIDEVIRFHNFKNFYPRFITEKVEGKYLLPSPKDDEKEFRKDIKKDWGFKCGWCETKISSKTDSTYHVLRESFDPYDMHEVQGRFCQTACLENYWYEKAIQFVMNEKMTGYIHTDKRVGS